MTLLWRGHSSDFQVSYTKDCKIYLLPNKEICKKKGGLVMLWKFIEDDKAELVPKQFMSWAKGNWAFRAFTKPQYWSK